MKQLAAILLDETATLAERDDAATYLGEYTDPDAVEALLAVATDPSADQLLQATAGESLALAWLARGKFDAEAFRRLLRIARKEAEAVLRQAKPEWLDRFEAA